MTETVLTPTRPYLARAIYAWICDNQLTPYLLVDASEKSVHVPQQYVKDGQIVLNITPHAVSHFEIENHAIHFSARFGGVAQDLYIPMASVLGIYSRENGQGLFFDPQEYQSEAAEDAYSDVQSDIKETKKPSLRVLD